MKIIKKLSPLLILLFITHNLFGQNKIELREGENIIKKGKVSYQAKLFSQPGKAYITNQRFYFVTSKLATKRKVVSIELKDIKSIEKGGASLKGGVAAAMNTIKINNRNDEKFIFNVGVGKRKKWIKELSQLID